MNIPLPCSYKYFGALHQSKDKIYRNRYHYIANQKVRSTALFVDLKSMQ